jgi:hypothetical protein
LYVFQSLSNSKLVRGQVSFSAGLAVARSGFDVSDTVTGLVLDTAGLVSIGFLVIAGEDGSTIEALGSTFLVVFASCTFGIFAGSFGFE